MLDSGAGISCISEKREAELEAHFGETRSVYCIQREKDHKCSRRRQAGAHDQAPDVSGSSDHPDAKDSLEVTLSLAVSPGIYHFLEIRSTPPQERIGVDGLVSSYGE